jgi:hypothetical protein
MQIENLPEVLVTTATEYAIHCETCGTCAPTDSPTLCTVGKRLMFAFHCALRAHEEVPPNQYN